MLRFKDSLKGNGLALLTLLCIGGGAASAQSAADLSKQALAAYMAKDFVDSAALYSRAAEMESPAERSGDEYNAACSLTLAGNRAGALGMLRAAIDDGYLDADRIAADSDFVSLRSDPEFLAALSHARAIVAADKRHWSLEGLKTPYAADLPMADKMAGLAEVWAEARYNFANWWHVPQLDWDKAYRDAIEKVQETHTTVEYYRELQRLMAQLHDGHSNVYFPEAYGRILARPPLRTRLIDGRVIVTGVFDPNLRAHGLAPGVEVLTVNGEPVRKYADEKVRPFESSDTQQDLDIRTYSYHLLLGPAETVWQLGVLSADGRRWTEAVPQAVIASPSKPSFEMRSLPGGIIYVNLRSFENDGPAKEFENHFAEIRRAKGLILDVRENGGGSSEVGGRILKTLIDRPVLTSRWATRTYVPTYRAWGQVQGETVHAAEELAPDPAMHFGGKVAVLAGPMTFSAAEDFLVAYVNSGRGALIGEPSGGSTGQPLSFELPGGGSARVCTKHDSFPDGKEFVGVGVPPSIMAHNSVEDVRAGQDAVLERAVAEVSR